MKALFKLLYDRLLLALVSLLIIVLITLNSLFKRVRMSHENGIALAGRVRIVDNPRFPENGFFTPGRVFPCRLRHASVSYMDDARLVARAASLKFTDAPYDSPLDLMMNSGNAGPFEDAYTFLQFMWATIRGRDPYIVPYLKRYPDELAGIRGALRYPDSYTRLRYYSKTPLALRSADGVDYYVKFRLLSEGRERDHGRANDDELQCLWRQLIRPGETRSRNYLKDDLERRIAEGPIRYHLEWQLYRRQPDDSRDVLNCVHPWDEETHPWLPLAEVELERTLDYESGQRMWFHISNLPKCMGVPKARSIHDPASLNHLRKLDIWTKRARLLSYRLFTMPKPIPDARVVPEPNTRPRPLCLPQDADPDARRRRQETLAVRRSLYRWAHPAGAPPHAAALPQREAFDLQKRWRMNSDLAVTALDLALGWLRWTFGTLRGLRRYEVFYSVRKKPITARRWMEDAEFARQRLAGINPLMIRRCEALPEKLPVTDALVAGLLDDGDSLQAALGRGRLYLLDYPLLEDVSTKNGYLTAPICLLYVDKLGRLLPIAAQLRQMPGPQNPVFTPKDSAWLWVTVTRFLQSADAHMHEIVSHLLRTHLVAEVFAVASARQLHPDHPLSALLTPHFRYTLAINDTARRKLLAPGGPIDKTLAAGAAGSLELLAKAWAQWSYADMHPIEDLKRRGVMDEDALPRYDYRDDVQQIWAALHDFVSGYLALFYRDDAGVAADTELQAWARELATADGGRVRDFPGAEGIHTRELLADTVTRVVYTASAGHAAVNNGQYDMFGYVPNVPGALYAPAPTNKCSASEDDLMRALPGFGACAQQILMVHLLSEPTAEPLGSYGFSAFADLPAVWALIGELRRRLDAIAATIHSRNQGEQRARDYLLPSGIGESIEI